MEGRRMQNADEPWQMNSNATLKIRKGPKEGKRKFRGRRGRDATDPKTVKEKEASSRGCRGIGCSEAQDEHESLILAQDERWRRA